ncbi:zinc ribbon domain-containing protein [Halorubrum ejinorense]|uniref:Zinc ribbon domain-containing protein n=1 Tax=Halorubrum ejinorense TaxID=425309 RepID=A0AAV3SWZ8_9EURY
MPSETDDSKYSVFGDDEPNETDTDSGGADRASGAGGGRDAPNDRAARGDGRPASLGGDDEGCPKCGGTEAETDEIATSGTGLTKMFDVQNRSFLVVSCANCGYSELYKGQSSGNAIDFFLG